MSEHIPTDAERKQINETMSREQMLMSHDREKPQRDMELAEGDRMLEIMKGTQTISPIGLHSLLQVRGNSKKYLEEVTKMFKEKGW